MRLLIQRVASAQVTWQGHRTEPAGRGLLALVGFHRDDSPALFEPMADKLVNLRIFEDAGGRMNLSLIEAGGTLLLVPQFTLYADCRKGRRPGFSAALEPARASEYFGRFQDLCRARVPRVEAGSFGAHMQVHLVNDGPVTILLDSRELNLNRDSAT